MKFSAIIKTFKLRGAAEPVLFVYLPDVYHKLSVSPKPEFHLKNLIKLKLDFTTPLRLVKGKGTFPSSLPREGNQPQGEGKIQGDPLYSPQKI